MSSESEARSPSSADVPSRIVRSQLQKILASTTFCRSKRLSGFLHFVVNEALDGHGDSLKEHVLATELYGKQLDFKRADDPTIRNDARRLRDKLREYYAECPRDAVIISLPKGGYAPVFERNAAALVPTVMPKPQLPVAARKFPRRVAVGLSAGLFVLLAAISTIYWLRTPRVPRVWQPRSLTALPGTEGAPSLSPDGNRVAFAWSGSAKPGPSDIWVKAVDSAALLRITDTPASESQPAWSPDGTQIAFVRAGEGVFIASQLGGSERRISNSGSHVRWTPDSQSVLIRDRVDQRPFDVYQISLSTLERRQLTRIPDGMGVWKFDVSPDGKTLAYRRVIRPGVGDVFVIPMPGGKPQRRTDWNSTGDGVLWSPDGRELIYNVGFGYPTAIWRTSARGTRPDRGTPVVLQMRANSPSISRPASGQPARLAFSTVDADISLRLIDLNASHSTDVIGAIQPFCDSSLVDYPGSFSPDGSKVAFTSERTGERVTGDVGGMPQLWVANRDGSGLRAITELESPEVRAPSWSPNSELIAFEASVKGNTDIYITGSNGGRPKRITVDDSIDTFPSWSQDGRWIYFSSNRTGQHEIWKTPSGGGTAIQITQNGGFEPIESLDGKSVYYLDRNSPTGAKLKQVDAGGGAENVVLEKIRPTHWAVTEKGVFFLSAEREFDAIDLYDPVNRKITRVGRLPFRVARIGDIGRLTVSRDGRWALTLEVDRWDTDIMIVNDFR